MKTSKQLDAEIAEVLSAGDKRLRRQRRLKAQLTPVEDLQIPADARRELTRFWKKHPALRKGCLDKYGFDPIEEEADYWRYGLAEPAHRGVLRDVRRNGNVFSLPLAKRWARGELAH
jgi:hypothetical protein